MNSQSLFFWQKYFKMSPVEIFFPTCRVLIIFFPPFADSSVTLVNVEHQLMYMYDADVIRHLVTELIANQGKTPQNVMSLNEKVNF